MTINFAEFEKLFLQGFSVVWESVMTASERLVVLTVSPLCTEMRATRKAGRTVVEAGRGLALRSVCVSPRSSQAGRVRNIQSVFSGMFHRSVQPKTKRQPRTLGGERGVGPFPNSNPLGPGPLETRSVSGFRLTRGFIWNAALKPIFLVWHVRCQSVWRCCHKQ